MTDKIIFALRDCGITVYDIAAQIGKVKAPYCVVRDQGTLPQEKTKGMLGARVYEVILLSPVGQREALDALEKRVRNALRNLPNLRPTGDIQPTGIEEAFEGLSRSILYKAMVRIGSI